MQSYYGSLPAAKRFKFTLCQRELQLPKGIVGTWNGKVLCWGCGQQKEKSFRGAAHVELPEVMKITGTGSCQDGQAQRGFQPLANPAECYFLGLPKAHKGQQRDIASRMPQTKE